MKFNRLLAGVSALALSICSIATVSYAKDLGNGDPSIKYTWGTENIEGDDYLVLTLGYEGFTGLSKYSAISKSGVGLTSLQTYVNSDNDKLAIIAVMDADFDGGTTGDNYYGISWAPTAAVIAPSADFAKIVFDTSEFDAETDLATITLSELQIAVTTTTKNGGSVPVKYEQDSFNIPTIQYGKTEEPTKADYEVAEKGYGVDAEDAKVASYYTIMFNNGLTADNATIAISKDATKEWKITDLPEIAASAKITWVFNGLTDGLYDVVKVLDGETELSAE